MRIMDYKQFEGHTPAEEWTTYSMGVHADGRLGDNPYHAVSIGGYGLNLPITKGADARLLAAAPELLAENKRYRKTLERIAREDYNQNHYEHTEERHIWNMMHNMIQQARMALGQDIETGELRAEEFGAESNCSCGNRFINQCYVCDTQICAYCNYNNSAKCDKCYEGDDSHWAEEFGAEFSRGEMLNLRKYIDYPMRWVNKNIRPSSDSKERKIEQKMKGQIPRKKTPDSFRHTIETPTWFKGIQLGILATIFGAMYVNETNKKRKK
jgi:hypothetical protein